MCGSGETQQHGKKQTDPTAIYARARCKIDVAVPDVVEMGQAGTGEVAGWR